MSEVAPNARGTRYDKWCLTLNNWTEEQYSVLVNLFPAVITFGVIGEEVAPNSGTEHLQCFFLFKAKKDRACVNRIVAGHWTPAKGSCQQNLAYCSKEGSARVMGEIPSVVPSAPKNSSNLQELIDGCATLEEFMKNHASIYCRNRNGIRDLFELKFRETAVKTVPTVVFLAGPTGCCKTRTAVELAEKLYPGQKPWISGIDLKWFDGYTGQKVAIMDDLRKSSMPFNLLLRVLDRYCIDLPVKHKEGGCFWNPEFIFVTCPRIPSKEFVFRDRFADGAECVYEDVGQLERRCTIIREYCVPLINGLDAWVNHRGAAAWAALMDRCYPVQESGNSLMDVPSE